MKHLFNDKDEWTEESRNLDREVGEALRPIIKKWLDAGYSIRDIQLSVMFSAMEEGLTASLK